MEGDCLLLGTRVMIPPSLREKVLQELHEGHQGISKMKALSHSYVWWPIIDRDLVLLVKSCEPCIEVKSVPPSLDLQPWMWPSKPWKRIHVDFVGPIFDKTYLVVVDGYSK